MNTKARWALAGGLLVAMSCGGRTELELSRSDRVALEDDAGRISSGGTTASGGFFFGAGGAAEPAGGWSSTGGSSSGGVGAGGVLGATGGATASGGRAVSTGGTSSTGGVSAGGAATGGADSGGGASTGGMAMGGAGSSKECDGAFECRGVRALQLILSSYGTDPMLPEAAVCVDLVQDGIINVFDYLELIQNWEDGCRKPGTLAEAGACIFPGDMKKDGCYDYFDFFAVLAQEGQTAQTSSPCADANEDGFVDVLDQGWVLSHFRSLACENVDFDPSHLYEDPLPKPGRCGDAPVGDLNGDGEVDAWDLNAVLSHLGLPVTDAAQCLDVGRNGSIDHIDALHVISRSMPNQDEIRCQATMSALDAFVEQSNQCMVDADCATFDAGCSHVAQHCSRVVFLNVASDGEALNQLTKSGSKCIGTRASCRRCTESAPEAACVAGRCAPAE